MVAKKNFDEINTGDVYAEQIAEATSTPAPPIIPHQKQGVPPTAEVVEMAREQGKTQGRAGCRAYRHNMAFTPENYEFIKCMARVRGQTVTAFVNDIVKKAIEDNAEIYQQALKFRDILK
jgi:hypothetical protein